MSSIGTALRDWWIQWRDAMAEGMREPLIWVTASFSTALILVLLFWANT